MVMGGSGGSQRGADIRLTPSARCSGRGGRLASGCAGPGRPRRRGPPGRTARRASGLAGGRLRSRGRGSLWFRGSPTRRSPARSPRRRRRGRVRARSPRAEAHSSRLAKSTVPSMQLADRCRSDSRGSRVALGHLAGTGAEVDDRIDVDDAGLLQGFKERLDLGGGRLWIGPALVAPDPAVGHLLGGLADERLDRLDVGRDPCGVEYFVRSRGRPVSGSITELKLELRAREHHEAVGILRLDLPVQVDDLDVQGTALDLGNLTGLLGEQGRQHVEASVPPCPCGPARWS